MCPKKKKKKQQKKNKTTTTFKLIDRVARGEKSGCNNKPLNRCGLRLWLVWRTLCVKIRAA